jgi:hypothetical protein
MIISSPASDRSFGSYRDGPLRARWRTGLGVAVVIFEVLTVLVLRAHYTVDVFAGLVTGLYAARLAGQISS